jgi:predicted glycosyltransferase
VTTAVRPSRASQLPRRGASAAPKILFYSHDTYGLGNIRRTLLLSQTLAEEYPQAAMLVVTGSPMIHAFRIPANLDYIKLPCLDRTHADCYEPKFLVAQSAEIDRIRRAILVETVVGFEPDLMIVDKRPGGVAGELLDALRALRRLPTRTRVVLGMRDILDEPGRTRSSLKRTRDMATIARYYDEVWIYGEHAIFDPIVEYAFRDDVARKTCFCGYLRRPSPVPTVHDGPPHALVTTGGGADGAPLITSYLEGLSTLPRGIQLRTTVVFGPQADEESRRTILRRFGSLADVEFLDFEPDLAARYQKADVIVSPRPSSAQGIREGGICEITMPSNCDDAIVTVTVLATPITAVGDAARASSKVANTAIASVLANDRLGGAPATLANVTLSFVSLAPANSKIRLDLTDGSVDVLGKTDSGLYLLVYEICEIAMPTNCARATVRLDLGGS